MYAIGENNSHKLRNACKEQIGVDGSVIAGFAVFQTKAVLKVVDAFFYDRPDFVGVLPILSTPDSTRVCAEVFFGVDVDHSAA